MTTDDLERIESAAIAIREIVANKSARGRPWSTLPRALRESYRQEAAAALQAARDYAEGLLTLSEADKQVAIEDAEKTKHPTISQHAQRRQCNA